MKLGRFLKNYPLFQFDVEAFLISTKHIESLRQQRDDFLQWLRLPPADYLKVWQSKTLEKTNLEQQYVSKEIIRKEADKFRDPNIDCSNIWIKYTSGTTGQPVCIWYAPEFYFDFLLQSIFRVTTINNLHDLCRTREIYSISVTDNQNCQNVVWMHPENLWGMSLQLVVDETNFSSFDLLFDFIDKFEPGCLALKPSLLEALLCYSSRTRRFPSKSLGFILSSGANLDSATRLKFEAEFDCTVINAYGMTEFGLIACECPKRNGMHVFGDRIHAWCRHENDMEHSSNTVGELVLSSTANRAMVLENYRTGDITAIPSEPCLCGLPGVRLIDFCGRKMNSFISPSGILLSPTRFHNLFSVGGIKEFQLKQVKVDEFILLIEFLSESDQKQKIITKAIEYVLNEIPFEAKVSVSETKFARTGKFERFHSLAG